MGVDLDMDEASHRSESGPPALQAQEESFVEEELSLPKAGHPSRLLRAKKANKATLDNKKKRATEDENEVLLEEEDEGGKVEGGEGLNLSDVGAALQSRGTVYADLTVHQSVIATDPQPDSPPSPSPVHDDTRRNRTPTFHVTVQTQKEG